MLTIEKSVLVIFFTSILAATANAQSDVELDSNRPASALSSTQTITAAEFLSSYRDLDGSLLEVDYADLDWFRTARERAQADLQQARAALASASAEVTRLLAEIKIDGAERVDIGGEVRAARIKEAEWRRVVEAVSGHILEINSVIAEVGSKGRQ